MVTKDIEAAHIFINHRLVVVGRFLALTHDDYDKIAAILDAADYLTTLVAMSEDDDTTEFVRMVFHMEDKMPEEFPGTLSSKLPERFRDRSWAG